MNGATKADALRDPPGRVLVVGHRGAETLAPENTWASFRMAYQAGADVLELDVQLTADGQAIVYHDFTLWPNLRDPRWVRDLSWEEISGLDVGACFGPAYAGERIPRFADLLEWARGRLPLWVDLKHGFVVTGDHRLEQTVLDLIDRSGMSGQVVIVSWDQVALAWIRDRRPEIPLAVNLPQRMPDPVTVVAQAGAQWAVVSWPQADCQSVANLQAAGIRVALANLFTHNYAEALRLGVDAVHCGDPARARAVLDGHHTIPEDRENRWADG